MASNFIPPLDMGTYTTNRIELPESEPTIDNSIRAAMNEIQVVPGSVRVDEQLLGLAIQNMRLRDELSLLRDEIRAVRALVICSEHDDCKANLDLARACAALPKRSTT